MQNFRALQVVIAAVQVEYVVRQAGTRKINRSLFAVVDRDGVIKRPQLH